MINRRIDRAVRRAYLALLWEALWPRLSLFLTVVALFLATTWFGLWALVPDPVRWVALGAFGLAAAGALIVVLRRPLPDRRAALGRVERACSQVHRPITTLTESLASSAEDPWALALWHAHRERLRSSLGRIDAGVPSPGMARYDPFALRFLVLLLLGVSFLYAGPLRGERISEAWLGSRAVPVAATRIEAWAVPPAYTGRAPVFLSRETATGTETETVTLPEGTIVTVLVSYGGAGLDVAHVDPAMGEVAIEPSGNARQTDGPLEYHLRLDTAGAVIVRRGDNIVRSWSFLVQPDNDPTIAFNGQPRATASGALALTYEVGDDYGVVAAQAVM